MSAQELPCFSYGESQEQAIEGEAAVGDFRCLIRAVNSGDLTNLADLLADSFYPQSGRVSWAYPLMRLGIYEDLRSRLRSTSPNYICLVAIASVSTPAGCQEELVGTVEMALRHPLFWQHRPNQYPYISNLAVRKSYRRQGVAQQLLLMCERTAIKWGFQDLYLHVLDNNYKARQLYLNRGYQLQQVESTWGSKLLKQPQRLFLHKHLPAVFTK